MTEKILRRPEVEKQVGLARSALYAAIAKGLFPKPVKLSERAVGWLESEIQQWIKERPLIKREGRK